jgi:hypothetical protein
VGWIFAKAFTVQRRDASGADILLGLVLRRAGTDALLGAQLLLPDDQQPRKPPAQRAFRRLLRTIC